MDAFGAKIIMENNSYTFITHFYGISLLKDMKSFCIGDFIFCTKQYILENYQNTNSLFTYKILPPNGMIASIDNYFIIINNISAPNEDEANNIFYTLVDDLINTILYLIPNRNDENKLISITKESLMNELLLIVNKTRSESFSNKSLNNPLYIIDERLFHAPGNDKRIFDYLKKEPPYEIQKKIIRAVSWIGQAMRNKKINEAFLELSLALESLLVSDTDFISKSITAQVSEDVAFLIGINLNDRIEICKNTKKLYGKRSSVVHPKGNENISESDYYLLVDYLKRIIDSLFKLIDDQKIRNSKELRIYIYNKKFST